MEDGGEFEGGSLVNRTFCGVFRGTGLVPAAAGHTCAGAGRDPQGDAIQPASNRAAIADGGGPAHQNQKGGLKCILGIVLVTEHRAANTPDHRSVAFEQRGEGGFSRLAMAVDEAPQKLGVGQVADCTRAAKCLDVMEDGSLSISDHRTGLPISLCSAR